MFHSSMGLRVVISMEWFQDSIVDSFLNCHLVFFSFTKIDEKKQEFSWEERKEECLELMVEKSARDILVIVTKQPWWHSIYIRTVSS